MGAWRTLRSVLPSIVTVAAMLAAAAPAGAAEWTVGLGAGLEPDYEGSDEYHAVPLWNIKAENLSGPATYAQLLATRFTSNLLPDPNWRLGVMAQYVPDYDEVENNKVQHLDGVDPSLLLGVMGGYDWNLGPGEVLGIEAALRADVLHGNGYLITFGPKYQTPFGKNKWLLTTALNATYGSKDYMDNYFSVSRSDVEQQSFDDRYRADDGFKDVAANLSLTYVISPRWSVTGLGQYQQMADEAKDSPVVDDEGDQHQGFGGLLVNYRF